jgi:hypothetical protein
VGDYRQAELSDLRCGYFRGSLVQVEGRRHGMLQGAHAQSTADWIREHGVTRPSQAGKVRMDRAFVGDGHKRQLISETEIGRSQHNISIVSQVEEYWGARLWRLYDSQPGEEEGKRQRRKVGLPHALPYPSLVRWATNGTRRDWGARSIFVQRLLVSGTI